MGNGIHKKSLVSSVHDYADANRHPYAHVVLLWLDSRFQLCAAFLLCFPGATYSNFRWCS
jgi:hypothetical protein